MRVRKAVIPAAGLGTRFLPATKATPKEMIPLVDKPGIQYVVEEAVAAGITDILIVTGRSKKTVEDHFDRSPELEATLGGGGKDERPGRDAGHRRDGRRPLRPPGRAARASATPSAWPATTSATSPSPCSCPTTSWPRARRSWPT